MDFECTLKTLIKPYETENLIFNNVINNTIKKILGTLGAARSATRGIVSRQGAKSYRIGVC